MSDHPNVETVKLMMEAIFSQDNDTLAKIFTDDFVFHFRAPHPRSRHHRHPTRVVSPARANQEPHHVCLRRCGPQPAHPGRLAAPSGRSGPAGGVARHPPATTSRGTTDRLNRPRSELLGLAQRVERRPRPGVGDPPPRQGERRTERDRLNLVIA